MCVKENVKIEDNFAVLTREQFNYLIEEKFDLYYYPIIRFRPLFHRALKKQKVSLA